MFRPVLGAILSVLWGVLLSVTPFGDRWVNASYDYLFRFLGPHAQSTPSPWLQQYGVSGVVILQMDTESNTQLGQTRKDPWDRRIHAKLLNRLADDGCRMVILDLFFEKASNPSDDQELAAAMRRLPGKVFLMAKTDEVFERHASPLTAGLDMIRPWKPMELLLGAAGNNNWGVTSASPDRNDYTVRQHWPFPSPMKSLPSLPWIAAEFLGVSLSAEPEERWLRYYGVDGDWDSLSYSSWSNQVRGFFTNKVVFVGNKPSNLFATHGVRPDEDDKFNTPYTRWRSEAVGGVEVLATEFLNLVKGDWLKRPPAWVEIAGLVFMGTLLGMALCRPRRWRACALAVGAAALVSFGAIWLTDATNYWFPWLVVAGGQIPCALTWALVTTKLGSTEEALTSIDPAEGPERERTRAAEALGSVLPDTDDYEIFHSLGQGAFGKVWLARNAVNQWLALKAVYLARFDSIKPYELEFNGIRKYKPVSDKHPGLLRIEFVSKQKEQGYFYYVMELADALDPGWEQNPSKYQPKDLAKLLDRMPGRRLPLRECLRIAIILAEALEYLHSQSLAHGDIKPQNIVFLNGNPKLADIGLVNDVPQPGQIPTVRGTPGYMAPEAVGTPQADIYALGMVLYVMFMGNNPEAFPSIATTLSEDASHPEFMRMNSIILRACQPDKSRRYGSAREMIDALRELQRSLEHEQPAGLA